MTCRRCTTLRCLRSTGERTTLYTFRMISLAAAFSLRTWKRALGEAERVVKGE